MIGIIDYGLGNIRAFSNIYESLDIPNKIVKAENDFEDVQKIILPGVGAFDYAITSLRESLLLPRLDYEVLECNKPVLGICLGMQLFMTKSYEFGENNGLNIIDGPVEKIQIDESISKFKLPHIGWREVNRFESSHNSISYFENIFNKKFYFVHSFESKPNDKKYIVGTCEYFKTKINSIILKDNIIGCQFHPEKSGKNGLKFIESFINFAKKV